MSNNTATNASSGRALPKPCPEQAHTLQTIMEHDAVLSAEAQAHLGGCERCAAAYAAYQQSRHPAAPTISEAMASALGVPAPSYHLAPEPAATFVQPPHEIPPVLGRLLETFKREVAAGADPALTDQVSALTVEGILAPYQKLARRTERRVGVSANVSDSAPEGVADGWPAGGETADEETHTGSHAAGVDGASASVPVGADLVAAPASEDVTTTPPDPKPLPANTIYYLVSPQRLTSAWIAATPSFRRPDAVQWRDEAHYSYPTGQQLTQVYALYKQKDVRQARLCLATFDTHTMSIHQRLCLEYISGMVELSDGEYTVAGAHFDDALDMSQRINDPSGHAALACLRGATLYHAQRYGVAIDYYTRALNLIQELTATLGGDAHLDHALELESLTPLASSYFAIGEFDRAWAIVENARRLLAQASEQQRRDEQGKRAVRRLAATIEWVAALLYRWSGAPEQALRHAMAASEVYSAIRERRSLGRIAILVADSALDLADVFAEATSAPQPMTRSQHLYLALAEPYVLLATTTLRDCGDTLGEALARLTQARFERMTRRTTKHLDAIDDVVKVAQRYDDLLLLALAQTARGDELHAHGEHTQSLTCYRSALDTVRATESPAMGVWAQRHLLRATEFLRS